MGSVTRLGSRATTGEGAHLNPWRRRLRLAAVAGAAAAALIAAGCSSTGSSSSSSGTPVKGGTATVALPADVTYNWIFPFSAITTSSVYNFEQFQWLMYRPLYMFGNNGISPTSNYPLSPADAPTFSNAGKTATITMKGWKWSNGESVDANDVLFYLHMAMAEKANWFSYSPGLLPDNIVSATATSPDKLALQLNKAYSTIWYTYNQLAELTPMPMAWDVTSLGAKPGSGGCTTDSAADGWAHCKAVWAFLTAQSKIASTYASSPLWSVVDGPWKLSSFSTTGNVTMVPNPKYSGSPKPRLSAVKFVPFTADSAEYTALKTGQLDVGYIPPADLPQKPVSAMLPSSNPLGSGYTLEPFYNFGIFYYQPNLNNPTLGAAFKQLYVRQALQETVDQVGMARTVWRGYAYPTAGTVPGQPPSQWTPPVQRENGGAGPYAFSISKAKALLTSHGWSEVSGVMTCQDPAKCGTGVAKGTRLSVTLAYSTGTAAFANEVAIYKSDASQAGISINLVGQSFNTIVGEASPCKPGPSCTWDALMYGGWLFGAGHYEPTGEQLFETGSESNSGSYSNPTMDQLIAATHTSSSLTTFHDYATFVARQLPFIWMPTDYIVQGVNSKLHGVTFNPLFTLLPEYWYFTK